MKPRAATIDDLVAACDPRVKRLVEATRRRILMAVPHATEKLRPGWGLIGYNAPAYFAFIVPERDHVRVGFEWGVMLSDLHGCLEGDGSQVRYVRITSPRDLSRKHFSELLRAAAAISPPSRRQLSRD